MPRGTINDPAAPAKSIRGAIEVRCEAEGLCHPPLQWTLDLIFERDLGQYVTLRDVVSLNRILDAAKKPGP